MSGKPALIREADVARILRGAAKAGITLGIVVKGDEARFVPVDPAANTTGLSALEAWKAKRNADRARGDT